jgi:hypothetical protein
MEDEEKDYCKHRKCYFALHCKGQRPLSRPEHCTCLQESRYKVINGYFISRYLTCAEVMGYRYGC